MKTQLRKPARSKASYTDQYRQEALELWRSQWPQRREGGGGAGHPSSATLPLKIEDREDRGQI